MASQYQIPGTPRVISPSPTPSEMNGKEGYFGPKTRSKTQNGSTNSQEPIDEDGESAVSDPELQRARSRSRSPQIEKKPARNLNGTTGTVSAKSGMPSAAASKPTRRKKEDTIKPPNGEASGFLSPKSVQGYGSSYWRQLSRSPSPLGLIPIHKEWRDFIHKHEIPRKALHVSIGFVALFLYYKGVQPGDLHRGMLTALIPIATADLVRFRWPAFNHLYIRLLGAFMRESEAHDQYNGVISYLAGAWVCMRFYPKDVGVMAILLLSWCDTAASTFGRLYGRYTPRIRRGKSLAGSLAAFAVGVITAVLFWGFIAPSTDGTMNVGGNTFAFRGSITLPTQIRDALGLRTSQNMITGWQALAILSLLTGFIASASEAIDVFGLDDNLTIPVLSGAGLSGLLAAFGS